MSLLRNSLSENQKKTLIQKSIKQGDVFYINLHLANGITPKDGHNSRFKYFVVLGFDEQGGVYGGIIINSQIINIFRKKLNYITTQFNKRTTHS